jgi:hypothetical protein
MTVLEGRTFACRNGDHHACQSRDREWSVCGCSCHNPTTETDHSSRRMVTAPNRERELSPGPNRTRKGVQL